MFFKLIFSTHYLTMYFIYQKCLQYLTLFVKTLSVILENIVLPVRFSMYKINYFFYAKLSLDNLQGTIRRHFESCFSSI